MPVSAVDCFQPAIQHTRDFLFKPFRWGQWLRLALVGILAAEVHSSGCNFNFPLSHQQPKPHQFPAPPALPHIDPARIAQFAALIVLGVFVALVVGLILMYVSSVFRFILFDSVLRKHCSIGDGWRRWRHAGRRYFLWKLVLFIAQGMFLGLLIVVPLAVAAALGWFHNVHDHIVRTAFGIAFMAALLLVFVLLVIVVQLLGQDFLVPIMALDDVDFADGWSRLLVMIRPELGKYAVYLLLKFVLGIAAAILFGIIALIPALIILAPAVIAGIAAYHAHIAWTVSTISLAVIGGSIVLAVLIFVVSMINVPATAFFPAFAIYFFAPRYPKLDALLNPPPAPAILETIVPPDAPPGPIVPPPAPEPIG